MIEDKDIEKLFQEELGGASEMPPASVKANIDKAIAFKKGVPVWLVSILSIGLVIVSFFVYQYVTCEPTQLADNANVEATTSNEAENSRMENLSSTQSNKENSQLRNSDGVVTKNVENTNSEENEISLEKKDNGLSSNNLEGKLDSSLDNSSLDNSIKPNVTRDKNTNNSFGNTDTGNSNGGTRNSNNSTPNDSNNSGLSNTGFDSNSDSYNLATNGGSEHDENTKDDGLSINNVDNQNDNGILDGKPLIEDEDNSKAGVNDGTGSETDNLADANSGKSDIESKSSSENENEEGSLTTTTDEIGNLVTNSDAADTIQESNPDVLVPNLPAPLKRLQYIGLSAGPAFPTSTEDITAKTGFEAELYYQRSFFKKFSFNAGLGYGIQSRNSIQTIENTTYQDSSYLVFTYDTLQQVLDSMVVMDSVATITSSQIEQLAQTQQFTIPINLGWTQRISNNWSVQVNLGARPTFNSLRGDSKSVVSGMKKFSMDINLQPNLVYRVKRIEFLVGPGIGYSAISRWNKDSQFYKPKELFWNVRGGIRFRF